MKLYSILVIFLTLTINLLAQNKDPMATQIVTEDLGRFWQAFEKGEHVSPEVLDQYYIKPGSKGVEGFMKGANKEC